MKKMQRTRYEGVYRFELQARLRDGKHDNCFYITFRKDKRKVWEKIGKISEGYSAEVARDLRGKRLMDVRHGKELPKEKQKIPLFKEIAEKYLEWAKSNKAREGKDDSSIYHNHLSKRFDNKHLDEISPFALEHMKSDMAKAGYSPKTISLTLGTLRSMFNKASAWNMHDLPNPVKKVKMPLVKNERGRFLSFDEAAMLMRELKRNNRFKKQYVESKDPVLHDIALISLHTGARAGEIFSIKGQDLNFETGTITLRDTKNGTTRHVFMTEAIRTIIMRRKPSAPDEYVFKDQAGHKIKEISRKFDKVVLQLKMNQGIADRRQKVVFHTLRHTFGSWLAIQGTPILTISHLMGHKTLQMTQRYAHLSPDHKKQAVIDLETAFNGKMDKERIETINQGGKDGSD